jgi:MSHA biogenesis protein MshK
MKPGIAMHARRWGAMFAVSLLLVGTSVCAEQGTADPMRPPTALVSTADDGPKSGLQSVFISGEYRAALIDGQLVEQGHKYGDATLVHVTESDVTLVQGRETRVLRLFPAVDKKMVATAPEAAAPAEAKKKKKSREKH